MLGPGTVNDRRQLIARIADIDRRCPPRGDLRPGRRFAPGGLSRWPSCMPAGGLRRRPRVRTDAVRGGRSCGRWACRRGRAYGPQRRRNGLRPSQFDRGGRAAYQSVKLGGLLLAVQGHRSATGLMLQRFTWLLHRIGKGNRKDMTLPVLDLREATQHLGLARKYGAAAPHQAGAATEGQPGRAVVAHRRPAAAAQPRFQRLPGGARGACDRCNWT